MERATTQQRVHRDGRQTFLVRWFDSVMRRLWKRRTASSNQLLLRSKDNLSERVAEALGQSGCAICRLTAEAMHRRVSFLFYESVNDPGFREEVRMAGGFCPRHSRMVAQHADALGIGIIMEDVVRHWIGQLSRGVLRRGAPRGKRRACPFCTAEVADERLFTAALLQLLLTPDGLALYEHGDGLCCRHASAALEGADPNTAAFIVASETRALQKLADELSVFVRRFDYRYEGEISESERDAATRALIKTAGRLPSDEEAAR